MDALLKRVIDESFCYGLRELDGTDLHLGCQQVHDAILMSIET